MYRDVEISQMDMAFLVQENVIRLQITAVKTRESGGCRQLGEVNGLTDGRSAFDGDNRLPGTILRCRIAPSPHSWHRLCPNELCRGHQV
jgi:hypothetical protein